MSTRGLDLCDREVLTIPELAKRSGISAEVLRAEMTRKNDPLPHSLVGRWPRVRWSAFIEWLGRQECAPQPGHQPGALIRRGARLAAQERRP